MNQNRNGKDHRYLKEWKESDSESKSPDCKGKDYEDQRPQEKTDHQERKERYFKTSGQPDHFPGESDLPFFQQEDCNSQLEGRG